MSKGFWRVFNDDGEMEDWRIYDIALKSGRIEMKIERPAGGPFTLHSGAPITIFGEDGKGIAQREWNSPTEYFPENRYAVITYSLTIAEFIQ